MQELNAAIEAKAAKRRLESEALVTGESIDFSKDKIDKRDNSAFDNSHLAEYY